jgi:uncharacterized protein YegP (UPF0339 family)
VWLADDRLWWWCLTASNGRALVTGDVGYTSRRNAEVAAKRVLEIIRSEVFVMTDEAGNTISAPSSTTSPDPQELNAVPG